MDADAKTRLADLKFEAKADGLKDMIKFIPGLSGDTGEGNI